MLALPQPVDATSQLWTPAETALFAASTEAAVKVDVALRDNFDYATATNVILGQNWCWLSCLTCMLVY